MQTIVLAIFSIVLFQECKTLNYAECIAVNLTLFSNAYICTLWLEWLFGVASCLCLFVMYIRTVADDLSARKRSRSLITQNTSCMYVCFQCVRLVQYAIITFSALKYLSHSLKDTVFWYSRNSFQTC